jgi:outer membrane protein assembly factor BamC
MFFKKILFIFLFLVGCSATEEFYDDITSPDYVNSSKAKRLEVPPDLTEIESNSDYNVPGEAKSYRKYLDREQDLAVNSENQATKIIQKPEGMKIVKSGNLRWLVVMEKPDLLWSHIKNFWEDLGFRIMVANKRTGIIETEWMDTEDIKLEKNQGTLSTFDKWLDSLSGFADKRKFRTRVELADDGNTEIYISQRSAEAAADQHSRILKERDSGYNPSTLYKIEEYKSGDDKKPNIEIAEQRAIDNYEIDSELLTRLMIKLGASNLYATETVKNPEVIIKAQLIEKNNNEFYISMNDPYDRSWRRLGLALDIIGFVTEDKNRSEGIYFVRYSEVELPEEKKEKEGIIDSLIFWSDDEEKKNDENLIEDNTSKSDSKTLEEETYTGIEAPEVKPLDEDYIPEDNSEWNHGEEETWLTSLWPSWGSEEQKDYLPSGEKRYRIRIKPSENNTSMVYLDFPNGKRNNTKDARKLLSIINEYLN